MKHHIRDLKFPHNEQTIALHFVLASTIIEISIPLRPPRSFGIELRVSRGTHSGGVGV